MSYMQSATLGQMDMSCRLIGKMRNSNAKWLAKPCRLACRGDQMNELDSILQRSTAEIEAGYFQLRVAGGDAPIYRERVYCYELYHQMRLCWPREGCPFVLNGEVDKGGHPILGPKGLGGIPDFLVHRPGDMNGNHAIIEVKAPFARDHQIEIDLHKLTRFTNEVGYERAIYLVYGTEAQELVERIYKVAGSMPGL